MELTFKEDSHEYFLGDERLPSVSEIIAPLKDFSMIKPEVLEAKRQFGINVHKMIELYLEDDLDEMGLPEDLNGCLNAFKKWKDIYFTLVETLKVEVQQFHPKLKYAGTPDLDFTEMIIDIKSRDYDSVSDPLQLAAYKRFGEPQRKGYILSLFPDGTYKFKRVPEGKSWPMFRQLLNYYRETEKINKQIDNWKKGAKK